MLLDFSLSLLFIELFENKSLDFSKKNKLVILNYNFKQT
jgi:hypothetical protein